MESKAAQPHGKKHAASIGAGHAPLEPVRPASEFTDRELRISIVAHDLMASAIVRLLLPWIWQLRSTVEENDSRLANEQFCSMHRATTTVGGVTMGSKP